MRKLVKSGSLLCVSFAYAFAAQAAPVTGPSAHVAVRGGAAVNEDAIGGRAAGARGGFGGSIADESLAQAADSLTESLDCRDIQRALQQIVADGGTEAADGKGGIVRTIREALRELSELSASDREACASCISREFVRTREVAEQEPCGTHSPCAGGEALSATSSPCAGRVCSVRKSCCRAGWDASCVILAEELCADECAACPHQECEEGHALAADCSHCAAGVCRRDPYCCDTIWDAQCVESALASCTLTCATTTSTVPDTTTTTSTTPTTVASTTTSTTTAPRSPSPSSTTTSSSTTLAPVTTSTLPECTDATACDDHDPCTDDVCTTAGACLHTPNTVPCDDLDPCTWGDRCSEGACVGGPPLACHDSNPCTDDVCTVTAAGTAACTNSTNTAPCDDGNLCTVGDRCRNGSCIGGPLMNCNDGNACTVDWCAAGTCRHLAPGCSDGDACTTDFCDPQTGCGHQAVECDDGDPCTVESCDRITGCAHTLVPGCN